MHVVAEAHVEMGIGTHGLHNNETTAQKQQNPNNVPHIVEAITPTKNDGN